MHKHAGLGTLVLVFAGVSSARAGEGPVPSTGTHVGPEVVVECLVLSEDERASVEARAHAELSIKGIAGGSLRVMCAEGIGRVSFEWGELQRTRAGSLPDVGYATVEALLELVDAVTSESASTASAIPQQTAPPEPTPTPAPLDATAPRYPVAGASEQRTARAPALESSRFDLADPWHVGAGAEAELWATEASGALGLRLRAGRRLALPVVLSAVVALDAASSEPEAVTVRVWRAGLEVAGCPREPLCIVLGTQLTRMVAEGPPDWSPASRADTSFAGTVRLEYVVDIAPLEFVPGAGVLLYPARRTVTLNDERVLSVPQLTAGLVLELRWRL